MIPRFLLVLALAISPVFAQEEEPAEETPTEPSKTLQSTATEELRGADGEFVAVEGRVVRIGATEGGGINFINMSNERDGFVAVVFKLDAENFEKGFDAYRGATIRVVGKIKIFRESVPQIVVKTPDQIEILEAAPEETAPEEGAEESGANTEEAAEAADSGSQGE